MAYRSRGRSSYRRPARTRRASGSSSKRRAPARRRTGRVSRGSRTVRIVVQTVGASPVVSSAGQGQNVPMLARF